jgi:hypothetical protein
MRNLWGQFNIPAELIAKIAVGAEHYPEPLTAWETLLAEIIRGMRSGRTGWTTCSETQ